MDNSRIYLKGKEVVTPFYLDETKNEILAKLEESISQIPVYELPAATTDTLGGIKVGENLSIDSNGVLSSKGDLTMTNTTAYTPTEDYNPATKKYVDDSITTAIARVSQFSLLPVDTLPTENIKTNVIYAVPSDNPKEQDVRIEYVYINNAWEILGTTKIDLSNYYTKAEINAMFANIANYTPVASAEEAANILNGTAEGSE